MDFIKLIDKDMNIKEQQLLEKGFQLFSRYGFHRISIDELCKSSNVSKMTFYKYYSNKESLFLRIVCLVFDDLQIQIEKILNSECGIKEKLDQISLTNQGMLKSLGEEMIKNALHLTQVKEYLDEKSRITWGLLNQFLKVEQSKGTINPRINLNILNIFLNEINNLFQNEKFSGVFENSEQMIDQINELIIYGLLVRTKADQ